MAPNEKKPRPEREETNRALSTERDKTDAELKKSRAHTEARADAAVEGARAATDARVETERREADAAPALAGASAAAKQVVAEERAVEDRSIARQRRMEDEKVAAERDDVDQALRMLLHLEREATDAQLSIERARLDGELAARDQFLGMVSHDLRTLLGGIALAAAMIARGEEGAPPTARLAKDAEAIQRYVARMNRLIGDLLDVVSIEAGKLRVAPERREATQLLRDAVEAFGPLASAKGIALTSEMESGALLARFDHDRILQVIANLVSNAIKFTPAGGTIHIRVSRLGEQEILFAVTIPASASRRRSSRPSSSGSGSRRRPIGAGSASACSSRSASSRRTAAASGSRARRRSARSSSSRCRPPLPEHADPLTRAARSPSWSMTSLPQFVDDDAANGCGEAIRANADAVSVEVGPGDARQGLEAVAVVERARDR